jgi:hypothetical protein
MSSVPRRHRAGDGEATPLEIIFAANLREDWEGLDRLLKHAASRPPHVILLTRALDNPLPPEERAACAHAMKYVSEAFAEDGNFPDLQLFIDSFAADPARDMVAVSARKLLRQIETGKSLLAAKAGVLAGKLSRSPSPLFIVPGRYENLELIRSLAPWLATRYLSAGRAEIGGASILGIGGLPGLSDEAPPLFQEREYVDGSAQAEEELIELIGGGADVFVSYGPIRHFADPGEEHLVRDFIGRFLPGRLILTSQPLKEPEKRLLTASDAEIVRGGSFAPHLPGSPRHFWEIKLGWSGAAEKTLFELGPSGPPVPCACFRPR